MTCILDTTLPVFAQFANDNSSKQRSQQCVWAMDSVTLLEESVFRMNRLNKWFSDSLINTIKCFVPEWISRLNESLNNSHLLSPTGGFHFTFRQKRFMLECKNTKYWMKCFLFLPRDTKLKQEFKLNTILQLKWSNNILHIMYVHIYMCCQS